MKFDIIKNPAFKKGLGVTMAILAGIATVSDTLSSQKKEREFEKMKKIVNELQSKR